LYFIILIPSLLRQILGSTTDPERKRKKTQ